MGKATRVLLTGSNGFLGAALWRRFTQSGYEVVAVKRSGSDVSRVSDLIASGGALDADRMSPGELFDAAQPDVVVHTACAYGRQGESATQMVEANLGFGLGLLEQCAPGGVPFVNTASMLDSRVNAYALSKAQLMQWLDHFSDKVPSVSLRFDHLYGPGDDAGKFAVWLLEQFARGAESVPLTLGEQTRDFIHVNDAAAVFGLVLEHLDHCAGHMVIPVGSCRETRLKDFVLLLAETWEQEADKPLSTRLEFGARRYREGEAMRTVVPPVVVAGRQWKAKTSLKDGVRELVRWKLEQLRERR